MGLLLAGGGWCLHPWFFCQTDGSLAAANMASFASRPTFPNSQPLPQKTDTFDRSRIEKRLQEKVRTNQPLIAHILVPLCDNDNQGIVKVNSSLGNGQNTKTNLYWGAGYGIKTHFQRAEDWKMLHQSVPAESFLLDRAIFYKEFSSGARVYLIADAYDGANMETCLTDFLQATAGVKFGSLMMGSDTLNMWGGADLIGFNGHNGLMDLDVDAPAYSDGHHRDAVVIACASHGYFAGPLEQIGGFPLLTTTNLLAPEAYVMRAVLDGWGELKSGPEIRLAAGAAYNKYQKCGLNGATRLFKTGW
jgi:hypothetical protein